MLPLRPHHILSLFFSALTAAPLLLLLLLQGYQQHLKWTARQRFRGEAHITVRIPASRVVWEEKGKEIIVEGRMFDIKNYRIQDGMLVAYGHFDERETAVLRLLQQHSGNQKAMTSLVQLLLAAQCFAVLLHWLCAPILDSAKRNPCSPVPGFYASPFPPITAPPPRSFH